MKLKWIFPTLAVVGLSLVSFKLGQRSVTNQITSDQIKSQLSQDLIALTKADFDEYQNLKTLEERYKKADEILGKIMTIFLAELGVKLAFKSTPATIETQNTASITPNENPATNSLSGNSKLETTTSPTVNVDQWKQLEGTLASNQSENQAFDELKKMEITDLYASLRTSTTLSVKNSSPFLGVMTGEITFFDRRKHKSDWLITIDTRIKDPNIEDAYVLITLTDKNTGKTFSRSNTSSGPMQDYMNIPGSKALVINIRADQNYIQIYPFGRDQVWIGNVYDQVKRGEYAMVGQVRLTKQ